MVLILYKNSAEQNRVNKLDYLQVVGDLNGTLREDASVTNMGITIEYNKVPDFNYVYIDDFKRYYFVTNITSVGYKLWDISLTVDVLMTYKSSILKCRAFIDRNEYDTNRDIIDRNRVISQGYTVETIELPNYLFSDYVGSYLITGLGFNLTERS